MPPAVVSDTRKFDRGLSAILHGELHWLDVPERITYKLAVMVYRCLHLADHLTQPLTSLPAALSPFREPTATSRTSLST